MAEIALPGQLRASFLRWAVVAVPLVVLLGSLSGMAGGSSAQNPWYLSLAKPDVMPPGWVFGVVWTVLYILQGVALAIILNARGAAGRGGAVILFAFQLILNLAWSPLFFRLHMIREALWLIGAIFVAALITTFAFGSIRKLAAWLMLPYLAWLCFAAFLNWQIDRLNPDGMPGRNNGGAVEYQLG